MTCPLCERRPARRQCPAKGLTICPTCCATKRLREIDCPDDCQYLVSARAHPPAVVQRQQEHDIAHMLRIVQGLSSRQVNLFSILTSAVTHHRRSESPRLTDDDVAEAALAQASTLETAAKGIVYEHQPASLPAQRLARLFRDVLAREDERFPRTSALAADVFRRLGQGARPAERIAAGGSDSPFLDALDRLQAASADAPAEGGRPQGLAGLFGGRPEPARSDSHPRIILP